MRSIHRLLLVVLLTQPFFILHAQQNPLHAYLPKDAKAIINVNIPSLAAKMSWQDVQQLSFFEEALKEAPLHVQEMLKDPSKTGVNFGGEFYIVMLPDPANQSKSLGYFYGTLADTAKFTAAIRRMAPKQKIQTAGDIKLLIDEKNHVAWTSRVFVMPMFKPESKVKTSSAKTGKKKPDTKTAALQTKQLLEKYRAMLTPVADPLIANSRFAELTREPGDLRFWINRNMQQQPKSSDKKSEEILKMMNWGMMQQGNYMAGALRFENGKAVVQMKNYMSDAIDSLYRAYPSKTQNIELLKKFPAGQPIALLSFAFAPEMAGAVMKASGLDKMLDSLAKKSSLKPLEIINGFHGDLTLAVIRAHEFEEQDTVTAALNGIQVFLAASVKDKAKVQPLLDHLQKSKKEENPEDSSEEKPAGPFGKMKPAWLMNDSFVVLSLSPIAAEKFLLSPGSNGIAQWAEPYLNHPSLFSLDLKTLFSFAMQMSKKKSGGDPEMQKFMETFDRVVMYGGKYENGAIHSTGELLFADSSENSLKQFVKLVEMGAAMGLKSKKARQSYDSDLPPSIEQLDDTKIDISPVEDVEPPPPPKQKVKGKK